MYHLITGLYAEWTRKARFNVLIVGPSGVGKSCLLEKIKSLYLKRPALPPSKIAPTVGQNVLEVTLPKLHLHFWDLGGSPSVRTLWSKYYDESDAVVWVVDARHFLTLHRQPHDVKGKGRAVAPDVGSEAYDAREASWNLLCMFLFLLSISLPNVSTDSLTHAYSLMLLFERTAELLMHPSLEGRPILIVANKADECESIATDLAQAVKDWFADKLAHIDDDPSQPAAADTQSATTTKQDGNIFADDEDDYRAPAALTGSTLDDREYEWDVLLASAIEG